MLSSNQTVARAHHAVPFQLDDALDVDALKASFLQRGRVLVSGILRLDCAIALNQHLRREREWGISLAASTIGRRYASPRIRRGFDPSGTRDALDAAYADGGASYSHVYEMFALSADPDASGVCTYYAQFLTFLNSAMFLDFVRHVTGIERICMATAAACRYQAGHFYAFHIDTNGGAAHSASFVFNLTARWEAQWGGLLQFRGGDGHVAEAYVPRFNSLSLFHASQTHAVSMVAPYAPHPRYSIGGALVATPAETAVV